jgi:hypothetical protein
MKIDEIIKKHLKMISESYDVKPENYMFFGNIEQMKRQCELLMNEDHKMIDSILKNHDWAQDHIAEAKSLLDQVFDFLMNKTNGNNDEVKVKPNLDSFSLNEDNENGDELTSSDYDCLLNINNKINRQDVIQWFNDNDINYYNMSDIEMYLIYIDKHKNDSEDFINEDQQIDESKNKPNNPKLWAASLAWAKSKYKVCPSAYCNGAAAKRYKSKGGTWRKTKK